MKKACYFLLTVSVLAILCPLSFSQSSRTVFVHLFEWKWTDVAKECENFLGPKGFAAVQVSPPQEHIKGSQWWTRYQPVSYKIESRGGSREQFQDMVKRCKAVGVDVYVDAIINHMSGVGSGIGVAGSTYEEYNYPSVPYGRGDFHFCGTRDNDISNYNNAFEVRNCELVNLADLATEKDYVRNKIAEYLSDLVAMGVAGFRIDAAKHMEPKDIAEIIKRVKGSPFIFQEVIAQNPSEPIRAQEYFATGDVTEFNYQLKIAEHFKEKDKIKYLETFGEKWGLMPSNKAIVFTSNHDSERGHGGGGSVLTFRDGKLYEIAEVFMLAWPYGYPKVMSSYEFSGDSQGPPSTSPYSGSKINCGFDQPWKCQHRWTPIANMVGFRNAAADKFVVTNFVSKGNVIAFGRAEKGFVVINREDFDINESFKTSLASGTYCNVLSGDLEGGKCTGSTVTVDADGKISISVPALSAVAIHVNSMVGSSPVSTPTDKTTDDSSFQSTFSQLYLRGTFNDWKANPMSLTADYTWTIEPVLFDGSENARFKFDVEGDWSRNFGDDNGDGIGDVNGRDIPISATKDSYKISFNDRTLSYTIDESVASAARDEL